MTATQNSFSSPEEASGVKIKEIRCETALGNARHSTEALLNAKIALKMESIYGEDGGDKVPLALRGVLARSIPPRWWNDLIQFAQSTKGSDWGSSRKPIFVTSSNFGIDGLYGLAKEKNEAYLPWASPHKCVEELAKSLGWGDNICILSHACVSAQLGLAQAEFCLNQGVADSALVFSFDFVGPFVSAGFNSLKILNDQFPKPYKIQEEGSVGLGDGMAYAIIEKSGSGTLIKKQHLHNEMFHFTSNEPNGSGFQNILTPFKAEAEGNSFWIKGHGTGTLEAGSLEARETEKYFPKSPLVSWKGSIGHTLGSCALVELAIALEAQSQGEIPSTIGTEGECFASNVATASFPSNSYNSTLLLCNAFGGAHGAMWIQHDE